LNASFSRVDDNKKAVAKTGWGPLNYNLLLHPEINLKKGKGFQLNSNIDPSNLNFSTGIQDR